MHRLRPSIDWFSHGSTTSLSPHMSRQQARPGPAEGRPGPWARSDRDVRPLAGRALQPPAGNARPGGRLLRFGPSRASRGTGRSPRRRAARRGSRPVATRLGRWGSHRHAAGMRAELIRFPAHRPHRPRLRGIAPPKRIRKASHDRKTVGDSRAFGGGMQRCIDSLVALGRLGSLGSLLGHLGSLPPVVEATSEYTQRE